MPGERVDHLPPNALFEDIKICRRLRTTPARDARDDGKLSSGFARHLKRSMMTMRPPGRRCFQAWRSTAR
jgi:hypothetical protein